VNSIAKHGYPVAGAAHEMHADHREHSVHNQHAGHSVAMFWGKVLAEPGSRTSGSLLVG
jgi:hypothetical protein